MKAILRLSPARGGIFLTVLLCVLLSPVCASAAAKPHKESVRCCFQLSVQAGGVETSEFGDGTGEYPYYRGSYTAAWRYAYRIFVKDRRRGHYDQLSQAAPDRFRVKGHLQEALHDWTVDWSFNDTPDSVETACCFTQKPHGWQPACEEHNASLGSDGFSEQAKPNPGAALLVGEFWGNLIDVPDRASPSCGLNDGRLEQHEADLFSAIFPGPSSKQLLHGRDFSRTCSRSVTLGPDGGIRFVGSHASVQMREHFIYFPRSKLYEKAKSLDKLTGTEPPGFQGPKAKPNGEPACKG
jgi:hypothetical protein